VIVISKNSNYALILPFILLFLSFKVNAQMAQNDFEILIDRILNQDKQTPNENTVKSLLATIQPDGTWPDVDYTHQSRSAWRTPQHLNHLTQLASSLYAGSNTPELKPAIHLALNHWLEKDYTNPNWWWNDIGVPRNLSHILLLLDQEITDEQRKLGTQILLRAQLEKTGQNLVWLADITAKRGLLNRDADLIKQAYTRIAEEIRISFDEGIQPDASFYQHGPCLYNHGYGAGFASDCSRLAALLVGTQFAFPQDKIDKIAFYVLDGSRWMLRGTTPDYGAKGREISRKGASARYLISVCDNLLQLNTGREEELNAFKIHLQNGQGSAVTGNKHFWRGDIITHHRKGYYTSARFFSTRTVSTDGPHNREGLKSHHLADGCNYLFQSGKEYDGIFPVWDWQKIPGTTVAQTGDFESRPHIHGTTDFVGGASDGTYGVATFDLNRETVSAHKSWFFFDREYVCLGAAIQSPSQSPIFTTLNQCHLNGDVFVNGQAVDQGDHALQNVESIHHDNVAYIFPETSDLHLRNNTQTGSWHDINNQYDQTTLSQNIFSLWIDHGIQPNKSQYAYIVAPNLPKIDLPLYTQRHGIQILQNTSQIQAVHHANQRITGAVFYEPGDLQISREITIAVNHPCALIMRDNSLTLSNPKNEMLTVAVTLTRGDSVETFVFELPDGLDAGKSVTQEI
jgi:chondroitin AC lyase